VGCGVRLEAETQFARRLIIGSGGAETNYGVSVRATPLLRECPNPVDLGS
jgi:hypothetical protein